MKHIHIKMPLLWILALIATGLLTGCGYHLRGALVLPDNLQTMAIEADQREYELVEVLSQTMRGAGVNVAPRAAEDVSAIKILAVSDTRDTSSIDRSGNVVKYELKYEVSYSVVDKNGQVLLPAESIKLRKTYDYNQADPVQSDREEQVILEQLRRDVSARILRNIGSKLSQPKTQTDGSQPKTQMDESQPETQASES